MDEIYIKARAKVNLNLEVLNKREDNYHNIKSVFQKVNLYDELYISKLEDDKFELETNIQELNNENNIIYKAYNKLKEQYKEVKGIKVIVNKKIPMQAGMAGGSTDCASFILGVNKLYNLNMSKQSIENMGKSLGADVNACFYNTALIAEGIGEIITKIDTDFKYYLVIIKSEISGNTKLMYQKLDSTERRVQPNKTDEIKQGLKTKNLKLITENLYNDFEYAVDEKDIIQNLKNELIENGAIGSLMTGSGACIYGLFENKETAKNAYNKLKEKYEAYICTSYNSRRSNLDDK